MQRDDDFRELYYKTYDLLIQYVKRMEGIGDMAEDIVQETYYLAYASGLDIHIHPNPAGWLYKAANYIAMNMRHKLSRGEVSFEELLEIEEFGNISEAYAEVEWKIALKDNLSESDGKIIKLCIEGYSTAEIAKYLEMTEENVRMRLHRCRRKMKRKWKR